MDRSRRLFVRLLGVGGLTALTGRLLAQGSRVTPGKKITLRDMLRTGLLARRPEEFAYIDTVVARVANGTLPESLVRSTFAWARRKRPYPFVYFQRGLRQRAKKLKIVI